jgi:hypothetical protein
MAIGGAELPAAAILAVEVRRQGAQGAHDLPREVMTAVATLGLLARNLEKSGRPLHHHSPNLPRREHLSISLILFETQL